MSKIAFARLCGVLVAAAPAFSSAQGIAPDALGTVRTGPLNGTSSGPGIQLAGTSDESQVTLKVSWADTSIPAGSQGHATWSQWSLVAQAPANKSEKRHALLDLNGLGNATSIGLDFNTFATDWQSGDKRMQALCDRLETKYKSSPTKPDKPFECTAFNFERFDPEDAKAAEDSRAGPGRGGLLFGGTAKLGAQDSSWYDPATFAKSSTNEHPWSVGLYAGWIPSSYERAMVTARFTRKKTFQDGDDSQRCLAGAGGVSTCVSGSFEAPTHAASSSLALEGRWLAPDNRVGISATVSRNFTAKSWATVVPIYFVSDGKGSLTGGVQVSRSSANKDTGFALFIGVPFAIWN